jgi:hypothetical protein
MAKDWIGNYKSIYSVLGATNHSRGGARGERLLRDRSESGRSPFTAGDVQPDSLGMRVR